MRRCEVVPLRWLHRPTSARWKADCSELIELEEEAPEGMRSRVEPSKCGCNLGFRSCVGVERRLIPEL
jgi:hypothetical protein